MRPLYKGVTNRQLSGTVPCYGITKFDKNSNSKRTLQASFFTVQAGAAGLAVYCEAKRPSLRSKPAAFRFWTADLLPAYTFIKNTISVVADDLGEAGYYHFTLTKKEPVRGGYVMPPGAFSIDTLLSRSKALVNQMREEVDDWCLQEPLSWTSLSMNWMSLNF